MCHSLCRPAVPTCHTATTPPPAWRRPPLPACAAGLDKCRELNTLVLSHNAVASLGSWLGGLPKLEKLSLSHNQLRELGASLK